jgi:hypothetical protein
VATRQIAHPDTALVYVYNSTGSRSAAGSARTSSTVISTSSIPNPSETNTAFTSSGPRASWLSGEIPLLVEEARSGAPGTPESRSAV